MGKPRDLANLVATGNILADGAVAPAELSGVTATASELNILDGVTATATELNLMDGVTATTAELNHVDGVTSNVQTQMDTKAPVASPTFTGTATAPTINASTALQIGGTAITATATELNKMDGVTVSASDINSVTTKAPIDGATFTGTTTIPTADINGGAIDGAVIGANSAAAVTATTVNASTKLQVNGTDVITNSRQLANIASVDSTTVAALSAAGVGSGSGKFSATADGAIAIGKPVALQSNGTVKQVGTSLTEANPISNLAEHDVNPNQTPTYGFGGLYYFPSDLGSNQGATIHVFGSSGDIYCTTTTFANGSNSFALWNTKIFLGDQSDNSGFASAFDPSTGRLLVVWRDTSNTLRNAFIRFYVNSSNQLDYNLDSNNTTSFTVRSSSNVPVSAHYSSTDDHFRVGYINSSSALQCITYQMTGNAGSAQTLTERGYQNLVTSLGNSEDHWMAHDSTNNRFMITLRNGSQSDYGYYYYFSTSTSNGAVTNHANGAFYTGSYINYTRCEFNPQDSCFLVVFRYGSGIGMKQIDVASNGTATVVGGTSSLFQEHNAHQGQRMALLYDTDTQKIVFVRRADPNGTRLVVSKINTSGSSISQETETELGSHDVNDVTDIAAIAEHNKFVTAQQQNNNQFKYTVIQVASSSSNNTSWIGFAESAISDSASGDILVVGSTAENQSGLTIGSTYYVQQNGTLATTSSSAVKAGRAIAADKLLITEGNAS